MNAWLGKCGRGWGACRPQGFHSSQAFGFERSADGWPPGRLCQAGRVFERLREERENKRINGARRADGRRVEGHEKEGEKGKERMGCGWTEVPV